MRITNRIMMNNSMTNINNNKIRYDNLNTQLETEQKIQRPSEDPIVAVRALRLRTTYAQVCQYLERNIPDADNWLTNTDDALASIETTLGDITTYLNQAANGELEAKDRKTIAETLATYRNQLFATANADYAGRTIFTGYKTDTTLTYTKDQNDKVFDITQSFKFDDIRTEKKITNAVDISKISANTIGGLNVDDFGVPQYKQAYVIRLGYDKLDDAAGAPDIKIYGKNAAGEVEVTDTLTATAKSVSDADAYAPGDDDVFFIAETGEYILGKKAYAALELSEKFEMTYTKKGFQKGDLNPIHYFDCVDKTDDANPVTYTVKDQPIEYEVSFSQNMNINIQGKDVFKHDMTRDIDEILDTVNNAINAQAKVDKIEELYRNATDGSAEKSKLQELLNIANRELDYATEDMNNMFSAGLTKYHDHQTTVSNARADVGARQLRLELTENRLTSQKLTVKNMKSANEQINTVDVTIELKEAMNVYDASLQTAVKVMQKRLIDYL